jgi:hypothetical protein
MRVYVKDAGESSRLLWLMHVGRSPGEGLSPDSVVCAVDDRILKQSLSRLFVNESSKLDEPIEIQWNESHYPFQRSDEMDEIARLNRIQPNGESIQRALEPWDQFRADLLARAKIWTGVLADGEPIESACDQSEDGVCESDLTFELLVHMFGASSDDPDVPEAWFADLRKLPVLACAKQHGHESYGAETATFLIHLLGRLKARNVFDCSGHAIAGKVERSRTIDFFKPLLSLLLCEERISNLSETVAVMINHAIRHGYIMSETIYACRRSDTPSIEEMELLSATIPGVRRARAAIAELERQANEPVAEHSNSPASPWWTPWANDVRDVAVTKPVAKQSEGGNSSWGKQPEQKPGAASPHAPAKSDMPEYAFHKRGEIWVLRFGGAETNLTDLTGLRYLHEMVSRPRVSFTLAELQESVKPSEVVASMQSTNEKLIDEQAKDEYKDRLAELDAEYAKAERDNDQAALTRLDDERENLKKEVLNATNGSGQIKMHNNDRKKLRQSMSKAVGRAINSIKEVMPEAGKHFDDAVSMGSNPTYSPEKPLDWHL